MRVILQRCLAGSVTVDGAVVGQIGKGLVALVGIHRDDGKADADWIANKMTGVRLWPSTDGKKNWDRSVCKIDGGSLLLVSQFTLFANFKGNKPDYR